MVEMATAVNRRGFLGGLAGASVLTLLSGCTDVITAIAKSCPTDLSATGNVNWTPDVAHPVFWGFQDLTTADGPPRDVRIYYPTIEGFTAGPPILKLCVIRWPVVLFLHGQPPPGVPTAGYHRAWWQIPAVLARSGYVVVVPNHDAQLPTDENAPAMVAAATADLNWVRTQWADREWADKSAGSTAVAGHSYGALLAARVAAANPDFGAFVSLSGPYEELNPLQVLSPIVPASFLMWAKLDGGSLGLTFEDLDSGHVWDQLTQWKYGAVVQAEHFDYLAANQTGTAERGPCAQVGAVTADLLALFLSGYMPVPLSRTTVPVGLTPPQVQLTPAQQFYAGAHLGGLDAFQHGTGCRLDLRWNVHGGVTGSLRLGS
jgi:pimeloyl-ACP methyl ester carboxylesterase